MCPSRGLLHGKKLIRNKQRDSLRFFQIDWLIRKSNSIRDGPSLFVENNGNIWDNQTLSRKVQNNGNICDNPTPSRNVLRSIFADWANLTAVIASNLHQWCWSTDQGVRSLQEAPCQALCLNGSKMALLHCWAAEEVQFQTKWYISLAMAGPRLGGCSLIIKCQYHGTITCIIPHNTKLYFLGCRPTLRSETTEQF